MIAADITLLFMSAILWIELLGLVFLFQAVIKLIPRICIDILSINVIDWMN